LFGESPNIIWKNIYCLRNYTVTTLKVLTFRQIVSKSNEDIVIFVTPTKPLTNQAFLEIAAHFKKKYPKDSVCQNLIGLFVADDKIFPAISQVFLSKNILIPLGSHLCSRNIRNSPLISSKFPVSKTYKMHNF
jgi:hypothetical protein